MSRTSEQSKRASRAEAALAEARRQVEAVQHALLSSGPLMRFLKLYDQLDSAAEPLTGRPVERSTPPHPYDRPMPHLPTAEARRTLRQVDRAVGGLCDRVADFLNGEGRMPERLCLSCGRPVGGRPPDRRRAAEQFLRINLPLEEEMLLAAGLQLGLSRQMLRRAGDRLGVCRVLVDGVWRWSM